jgi:hypothetical protein
MFKGTTQELAQKLKIDYNTAAGLITFLRIKGKIREEGVIKKDGQKRGRGQNIISFDTPVLIDCEEF